MLKMDCCVVLMILRLLFFGNVSHPGKDCNLNTPDILMDAFACFQKIRQECNG